MKDLTFCLCSYTDLSLSSRWCPFHHSLSSVSLRAGWLSPTRCEGTDTKSPESETLWWSFPDEEKEGWCCIVLCSACGPDCTKPCAASRVLVSLVPGRLMTGGSGTLGLLFEITLALLLSFWLGWMYKVVWEAEIAWEACGSSGNWTRISWVPTWSINHRATFPH